MVVMLKRSTPQLGSKKIRVGWSQTIIMIQKKKITKQTKQKWVAVINAVKKMLKPQADDDPQKPVGSMPR